MTADENLFTYDVLDRTIQCRRLTEGQTVMASRMLERWRQQVDGAGVTDEQRGKLLMQMEQRTLDIIESQIVDPGDVTWIEEQMLLGKVDFPDLRPILSGGRKPEPVADDQPRKAVKAARKPVKRTPARGVKRPK